MYESWGRTGTCIGSKLLDACRSLQCAKDKFNFLYTSKTGNIFGGGQRFRKQPHKFYRLDVEANVPVVKPETIEKSKLLTPVYNLMQRLFDVTKVDNSMVGCALDFSEMPLGKISTKQMKMAMSTLQNIEKLIQTNGTVHELRAATNQFYTLIPHAFGINCPPAIDTIEAVTAKSQMLENFLSMEMINDFLGGANDVAMHPLDMCYCKLNATIEPLAKDSENFRQLCEIVQNSYGVNAGPKVLDIFRVQRHAEVDHDNCHINWKLKNHQLLWHGSRVLNFANILSNGLKIGPPEALATGKLKWA